MWDLGGKKFTQQPKGKNDVSWAEDFASGGRRKKEVLLIVVAKQKRKLKQHETVVKPEVV